MKSSRIRINAKKTQHTISKYLYGQFIEHLGRCTYEGIWVGRKSKIPNDDGIRTDVVEALRALELPVLRWPGGCFADAYHWRDGIGPADRRPRRINIWWSQPESNEFGTDEFIRFCRLIKTEPYICANVGSGSPQEARDWIEYCNATQDTTLARLRKAGGSARPHNVRFWGVGNEMWGCGGNVRPEYYADLCCHFATFMQKAVGKAAGFGDVKLIACGSHMGIPEWDETLLKIAGRLCDYLAIHIYAFSLSNSARFSADDYYSLMAQIEPQIAYLEDRIRLAERFSTDDHRIGVVLDEWGTWHEGLGAGLFQQNTLRDAIFAAVSLNRFHDLGPGLFMANIAQTMNVLQALILTRGPKMLRTPTYHVYDMYRGHRGGKYLPIEIDAPSKKVEGKPDCRLLSASASAKGGKRLFLTLVNLDLTESMRVEVTIDGVRQVKVAGARRLTAKRIQEYNTFDKPNSLVPRVVRLSASAPEFSWLLPAKSITAVELTCQA